MERTPRPLTFCLLSFEGPDRYSLAGGLGVRITDLAETLSDHEYETHLMFVGEPNQPGHEVVGNGHLTLHRWCQWISVGYPGGVYDGEEDKLRDFTRSAPPYIIEQIVRPAVEAGRTVVILAEEWHTAEAVVRLKEGLRAAGLERQCVLFWNANNMMSAHRVEWGKLNTAAHITTVSRYMKHLLWPYGVNPLVIPNGITERLFKSVPSRRVAELRSVLDPTGDSVMLFKVGRFDPAKRWIMAMEAAAMLKSRGNRVVFPIIGGVEDHGNEVLNRARGMGLTVTNVRGNPSTWEELMELLRAAASADVINLRFLLGQELLRPFYAAADGVLANSGHEPFGLVGLEAMAAGGIAFTGSTGEEYAFNGSGAISLDTDRPEEIVGHLISLKSNPDRARTMRADARRQASGYSWEMVVEVLLDKVESAMEQDGVPAAARPDETRVQNVVVYTVVHQPRRLRLPAKHLPMCASAEELEDLLFDEPMNERYFRKVAGTSYYPAIDRFSKMIDEGFKLSIGFSLSFVEQAEKWDPVLLSRFRTLVRHENVELVAVEPTHGFVMLWDVPRFINRMIYAADRLEAVFGERPIIADTTELMMSDTIYHALEKAGFEAAYMDGRPWVMNWRRSTQVYHHGPGSMKLLTRHYDLSDDVGYRFSDRAWSGWPLKADTYASWIAGCPGDVVVIGWDFETFGEHHREDSGIFNFMEALPREAREAGLSFLKPSEAVARFGDRSDDLPMPEFATTWAGSGGLEFFLGNDAQKAVFHLMIQAYNKAMMTRDPRLVDLALWLSQSDNLHLIQWFGKSGPEAEVSAYFTPDEWWQLGDGGIVNEIQEVYKQFIRSLDGHMEFRIATVKSPTIKQSGKVQGRSNKSDSGLPFSPESIPQKKNGQKTHVLVEEKLKEV